MYAIPRRRGTQLPHTFPHRLSFTCFGIYPLLRVNGRITLRCTFIAALAATLAFGSVSTSVSAIPIDLSSGTAGFFHTPSMGGFSDLYTFTLASEQIVSLQLSSVVGGAQDVDFSNVFLSGPQGAIFHASLFNADPFENWGITNALLSPGGYTLTANGLNSTAAGTYAGTIALSGSSSVIPTTSGGPLDLSSGSTGFFHTPASGAFSDLYTFSLSSARAVNVLLSSAAEGDQKVDISTLKIEGPAGVLTGYELSQDPFQNWVLTTPVLTPGSYTLTAGGTNSANVGSYAGSIAVSNTAMPPPTSIPEPGTWALMVVGLAAARVASQRRK